MQTALTQKNHKIFAEIVMFTRWLSLQSSLTRHFLRFNLKSFLPVTKKQKHKNYFKKNYTAPQNNPIKFWTKKSTIRAELVFLVLILH